MATSTVCHILLCTCAYMNMLLKRSMLLGLTDSRLSRKDNSSSKNKIVFNPNASQDTRPVERVPKLRHWHKHLMTTMGKPLAIFLLIAQLLVISFLCPWGHARPSNHFSPHNVTKNVWCSICKRGHTSSNWSCPCAKPWNQCTTNFSNVNLVTRSSKTVQLPQRSHVQSLEALNQTERHQASRICLSPVLSPRLHARFGHLNRPQASPMVPTPHTSNADAGWLAVAGCPADADVDPAVAPTGVQEVSMQEQAVDITSPGHRPADSPSTALPQLHPNTVQQDAPRFSHRRARFRIPR